MASRRRSLALIVAVSMGALVPGLVATQPAGAADLVFGVGSFIANTTTLSLTGPSVNATGTVHNGVAVFKFGNVTLPSGASITAIGNRPFELVAAGTMLIGGVIVSNGVSATESMTGPNAGGAGGGAGGIDGTSSGGGPGGGGHASTSANGAGGGGFSSAGAPGGLDGGGTVGAGGAAYGNLDLALQGGSGGAGGSIGINATGGGGGGGAIGLFASTIVLQTSAAIIADGGAGSGANNGGSGGGSGGGIILHATTVRLNGVLVAAGGAGGGGGSYGDAGGGSGGRIAVQFKSLSSNGTLTTVVVGGTSGTTGTYGHGYLSSVASGGPGILSFTHIDSSQLSSGPNRSVATGATTTVTTRLTDANSGAGITKVSVGLYRRMLPSGAWRLLANKITSGGGQAQASVHVTASAQYQWRFLGGFVHDPATSAVQSLLVR